MSNKWVRSISFNKTNQQDILRLKLIGKKSFSRFIKKLLDEEIKRTATTKTDTPQPQRQVIPPRVAPKKPQVFNPMLRK